MTQHDQRIVNQRNNNDITPPAISDFLLEDYRIDKLNLHIPTLAILGNMGADVLQRYLTDIIETRDVLDESGTGRRVFEGNLRARRNENNQYKLSIIGSRHIKGSLIFAHNSYFNTTTVSASLELNPSRYIAHLQKRQDLEDSSSSAEKLRVLNSIAQEIAATTLTNTDNFISSVSNNDFQEGLRDYLEDVITFLVDNMVTENIVCASESFEALPFVTLARLIYGSYQEDRDNISANHPFIEFKADDIHVSSVEIYWEKEKTNSTLFVEQNKNLITRLFGNAKERNYSPHNCDSEIYPNSNSINCRVTDNIIFSVYPKTHNKVRYEVRYYNGIRSTLGSGRLRQIGSDIGSLPDLFNEVARHSQSKVEDFRIKFNRQIEAQGCRTRPSFEKFRNLFKAIDASNFAKAQKDELWNALMTRRYYTHMRKRTDMCNLLAYLTKKKILRKERAARYSGISGLYYPHRNYASALDALSQAVVG